MYSKYRSFVTEPNVNASQCSVLGAVWGVVDLCCLPFLLFADLIFLYITTTTKFVHRRFKALLLKTRTKMKVNMIESRRPFHFEANASLFCHKHHGGNRTYWLRQLDVAEFSIKSTEAFIRLLIIIESLVWEKCWPGTSRDTFAARLALYLISSGMTYWQEY